MALLMKVGVKLRAARLKRAMKVDVVHHPFKGEFGLDDVAPSRLTYEIKQHPGFARFNPGPRISMLWQS